MNLQDYAVIPPWVLDRCAKWQMRPDPEKSDCRARHETHGFFEYDERRAVYIVEEPTSVEEAWNHDCIPQLEVFAREFGAKIIRWDTDEAKAFYLARTHARAEKFKEAANPFACLHLNHDRTRCDLVPLSA